MTAVLVFDADGFPTLLEGADSVEGAIDLSDADAVIIRAAMSRGDMVRPSGDGWSIITPPAPAPPAVLSREAFCVALIGVGILTEAEAIEAALGAWPPKFEPALAGKPLVETLTIKNLWRETKTVSRDAPLFADLLAFYAGAMNLSAAKAKGLGDQIFGITA